MPGAFLGKGRGQIFQRQDGMIIGGIQYPDTEGKRPDLADLFAFQFVGEQRQRSDRIFSIVYRGGKQGFHCGIVYLCVSGLKGQVLAGMILYAEKKICSSETAV